MYFTHTEDLIENLLTTRCNIQKPEDLSIEHISCSLGIDVHFWLDTSMTIYYDEIMYIMLNNKQSKELLWLDFCHELAHIFLHAGRQDKSINWSDWINYQESKADYLMRHICIPTFMLQQEDNWTISDIINRFKVTKELAIKRFEEYSRNKQFRACKSNRKEIKEMIS